MDQYVATPPTDPAAVRLLDAYFAERTASFPPAQGAYAPTYPADEPFTPPAGVFLLLHADGVDIGCGGVRRIAPGDDGLARYEVKHLWVAPSARGGGRGRALLVELERRAVEMGAEELVLDTNASLEAAGSLYRSLGYVGIPPYNDNPNATHWFARRP
ncbi:hypothetical protein ARHIZOSPH14_00650 [Agromyces rhizosphaerae]|uniref:N-acetyltransferase domain-containing protein n=1 Tax=Agromyces rhizosphaerae TaxID=88374 RepID=A0A9W6CXT2_9MICO|nr:GNAT family N-acetyltransferase [Agromyces rhizosphaerae]GLI25823.1 hypothetical protein ARHIZOSPH14_00650 [Agromyces rhizosphaerae]